VVHLAQGMQKRITQTHYIVMFPLLQKSPRNNNEIITKKKITPLHSCNVKDAVTNVDNRRRKYASLPLTTRNTLV